MKEPVEKFEGQSRCLGEIDVKYITFSVPIEKEVEGIDVIVEEITKTISYNLKFSDSTRLTTSSLSNVLNNRAERIHQIKCRHGH